MVRVERFFYKVKRAPLERLPCGGDVAVRGQDDDWQRNAMLRKRGLEFEAAHATHPEIK